ncbi:MAG: DnaB-like helicase N-terminal domain-containing protein [Planctomycetaceae bacterium]
MNFNATTRRSNSEVSGRCKLADKDARDVPPHDLEAERCVLGCGMFASASIARMNAIIGSPTAMYGEKNRIVYSTMLEMHLQGTGIDAVTLRDALQQRDLLHAAGGVAYIFELMETVPHAEHAEHYAKIVREKFDRRRAAEFGRELIRSAHAPSGDMESIRATVSSVAQFVSESSQTDRTFAGQTFGELLAKDIPASKWLIEGILIAEETCAIIAPAKCLKTTILIEMAVAMATGTRFMNRYLVPQLLRIFLMLGETPEASARAMLTRSCEVRDIDPNEIGDTVRIHCGGLPRVASDEDLRILERNVREFGADVTFLDPLYLAAAGLEMSQVTEVGPRIRAIGDACKPGTLLLVHHATKGEARQTGTTLRLESGAGAGVAESVGQWFILNRESEFDPEADEWHSLNAAFGGRGGHGGRLSIRFKESTGEFDVSPLGSREEAREAEREERERKKAERKIAVHQTRLNSCRNLIRGALMKADAPLSARKIEAGLRSQDATDLPPQQIVRDAISQMEEDRTILPCEFKCSKTNRRQSGFIHRDDRPRFASSEWVTILADDPTVEVGPDSSISPAEVQ